MLSTLLLLAGDSAVAEGPTGVVAEHTFGYSAQEVDVRAIGDYDLLSYRGAESDQARSRIGHPRLPVFTHHFILPPGTKVDDLVVRVRTTSQLEGSYWPLPIQSEEDEFVPPDDEIYGSYEPYPAEPALLTVDGYMQGYHLVTLQVWPLQFVGALEKILVVTEVEVGASVIPLTAEESERVFRPQRQDWRPWEYRPEVRSLMNHVLNPEGFATFYRPGGSGGFDTPWAMSAVQEERPFGGFRPTEFPSLEGPPVNMVIITDDVRVDGSSVSGMTDVFEDWAEWKTSKGIPTVVKTVTWIDSTVDLSGNESDLVQSDTARVWLPEVTDWGWPRRILGGTECAPTVYDIDDDGDLEIFAAGKKIYAWHHDGDPLIEGNDDGLFYDPKHSSDGAFVVALAIGMLDGPESESCDVVGNYRDSLFVVTFDLTTETAARKWARPVKSSLSAPIIEDLDGSDGTLEVLLPGDNDSVYVWTHDGYTFRDISQSTHGRFARNPDGATYCYRSLAVGDIHSSSGVEIVQVLRNGKVVAYPTTQLHPTRLWEYTVSSGAKLSTPLIGDVDGDDHLEVVTTRSKRENSIGMHQDQNGKGGVWVLNGATGLRKASHTPADTDSFGYRFKGAAAALADLDNDGDPDIVAGGGRFGKYYLSAKILRLHLFFDQSGLSSDLDTVTVDDAIPIPGRKFASNATWSQPVVGDLDGDDSLEVLVPNDAGYLACYEWDTASDTARVERGWPQLFEDKPMTPCIADLDGTSELELVVLDKAGWLHVFQLPGNAQGARLPWPQYGHDARNTFNVETEQGGRAERQPPEPGTTGTFADLITMAPNPLGKQTAVWLTFTLDRQVPIELEVFDLQGRRVKALVAETLAAGKHRIEWDATNEVGSPVGSGIYFLRLKHPDGTHVRKVSVVR